MTYGGCVVIVDDDDSFRAATLSLLRSMRLVSVSFASAEEFLSSEWVDRTSCLLVDVNMPGMNGLALQRHLTAVGRRIPLIFLSALVDDEIRLAALRSGAVSFMTKPVSDAELLDGLRLAWSSAPHVPPQ